MQFYSYFFLWLGSTYVFDSKSRPVFVYTLIDASSAYNDNSLSYQADVNVQFYQRTAIWLAQAAVFVTIDRLRTTQPVRSAYRVRSLHPTVPPLLGPRFVSSLKLEKLIFFSCHCVPVSGLVTVMMAMVAVV